MLSGFAALLYQISWMRQFSTVFGTSEIAIATVLSAYMGGLALGSALSAKLVRLIKKPILFYGVLEVSIAVSALLVPTLLKAAQLLYIAILGDQTMLPDASGIGQPLFYFFVAFIILLTPTACMGATLPVLISYVVKQDFEITNRVGFLYAMNTFGAIFGVLIAGFILLPNLGLKGTVWFGVAINFLVFLMAVAIARVVANQSSEPNNENTTIENSPSINHGPNRGWIILPIMAFSGIATFVYEVLWTRLLSHILGGSVSAFAIMLASFLSGIALGSFIASHLAKTRTKAIQIFVFCQLGIAVSSMAIYFILDEYLPVGLSSSQNSTLLNLFSFAVLMPATLFIGATFPLAVRVYALSANVAARSSAQVYAWNTIGAILGAAIAGFFLVPLLKYEGTIFAMVILNTALACVVAVYMVKNTRIPVISSVLMLILLVLFYRPLAPETVLRSSPISTTANGEILYYEVGRSSTVFMYRENGAFLLRNNGLPESAALPVGAPNLLSNQRLLGALPVMARPDAKSVLIVGLGGGAAVSGVPPTVETIDVIELEPRVVDANQIISEQRKYQPLKDPRVSIVINDAHSALALSNKKYDVIVSQPSHPWTAGASHLYTREFMQLVANHLTSDGVYLQWINSQFLDENLLKSLSATIVDVYPFIRVYQWSPEVLFFLASAQPIEIEKQIVSSNRPFIDAPEFYLELGAATAEDAAAALMMDDNAVKAFSQGSPIITDDSNRMAMQSSAVLRSGKQMNLAKLNDVLKPWVPALNHESWLHKDLGGELNFNRIAKQYSVLKTRNFVEPLINALEKNGNPKALLVTGKRLLDRGEHDQARELFSVALKLMPNSNEAKWALVQPDLRSTARSSNDEIIDSMTGSARAVAQAVVAFSIGDIQTVANLDEQLSKATPEQSWFAEAVKLRVDWRNSVTNSELRQQFADQAWQILDLAMANENDQNFLAMRIVSAAQAQQKTTVIESSRRYIGILKLQIDAVDAGYLSPTNRELNLKLNQINTISKLFIGASQQDDKAHTQTQTIQNDLNELIEQFQTTINRAP